MSYVVRSTFAQTQAQLLARIYRAPFDQPWMRREPLEVVARDANAENPLCIGCGVSCQWQCAWCGRRVCRQCVLCVPGPRPEIFNETLCSAACWEKVGRPEE